jgi:hypothetical protein
MWHGCNLSEAACDALFCAACDCIKKGKRSQKVKNDDVEGEVHTEYESGMTGSIGGILFEGDIDTEEGSTQVKYIVLPHDLQKARKNVHWVKWEDFLEEMRRSHKKSSEAHQWN